MIFNNLIFYNSICLPKNYKHSCIILSINFLMIGIIFTKFHQIHDSLNILKKQQFSESLLKCNLGIWKKGNLIYDYVKHIVEEWTFTNLNVQNPNFLSNDRLKLNDKDGIFPLRYVGMVFQLFHKIIYSIYLTSNNWERKNFFTLQIVNKCRNVTRFLHESTYLLHDVWSFSAYKALWKIWIMHCEMLSIRGGFIWCCASDTLSAFIIKPDKLWQRKEKFRYANPDML